MLLIAGFFITYGITGRYQPKIPPPPALPTPNALDDYIAAGILFDQNGGDKPMYGPNGTLELLNESSVVQANQPALARLREGLTKECGVPFEPSFEADFGYLGRLRGLARLLSAESDVYAAGGNLGRSAESAIDAIQLGADLQHGGMIIHGLTGASIQSIGQAALQPRIEKLSDKECRAAVKRLQAVVLGQSTPQSIVRTEKQWLLTCLTQTDGRDLAKLASVQAENASEPGNNARMFSSIVWHLARDRTVRDVERYTSEVEREAGKPTVLRRVVPEPRGIALLFVPVFGHAVDSVGRTILRNRLLLIALAVRGYRLQHGDLPASLSDTDLDPRALIDPDSGRPVIYKRSGRDYLLYGVGPDGKDDGGIPANEGAQPLIGDVGVRRFVLAKSGSSSYSQYRLVPHMRAPVLPPGSPPLKD